MQNITKDVQNWLIQHPDVLIPLQVSPIKLDASLRVYFRVKGKSANTFIFCQIEAHENFQDLMTIHNTFISANVAIPRIIQAQAPYILYEDLGQTHLKTHIREQKALTPELQDSCIEQIMNIQSVSNLDIASLPRYKQIVKSKELRDLKTLLRNVHLMEGVEACVDVLLHSFSELPEVLIHHDFHWENLMVSDGKLRIIDYHEPYLGPPSYDLASLIADRSFYLWSPPTCHALVDQFCKAAQPIYSDMKPHHVWTSVALRLLKIIGNFDRLSRDIRPNYKDYFDEAIKTLKMIPWIDVLNKKVDVEPIFALSNHFSANG